MSVHLYTLGVARELARRLDVAGLERVRQAQLDYDRDRLEADDLRPWKRGKARRSAETRFRVAVANAATASTRTETPDA